MQEPEKLDIESAINEFLLEEVQLQKGIDEDVQKIENKSRDILKALYEEGLIPEDILYDELASYIKNPGPALTDSDHFALSIFGMAVQFHGKSVYGHPEYPFTIDEKQELIAETLYTLPKSIDKTQWVQFFDKYIGGSSLFITGDDFEVALVTFSLLSEQTDLNEEKAIKDNLLELAGKLLAPVIRGYLPEHEDNRAIFIAMKHVAYNGLESSLGYLQFKQATEKLKKAGANLSDKTEKPYTGLLPTNEDSSSSDGSGEDLVSKEENIRRIISDIHSVVERIIKNTK
jgi:hypothetical protein